MKPAYEPVILARKPGPMRELGIEECRVAYEDNARHEKGGSYATRNNRHAIFGHDLDQATVPSPSGRWPANLILECTCDETREGTAKTGTAVRHNSGGKTFGTDSDKPPMDDMTYAPDGKEPVRIHTDPSCPCAMLDGQTGTLKSGKAPATGFIRNSDKTRNSYGKFEGNREEPTVLIGDSGGASRFFYKVRADAHTDIRDGLRGDVPDGTLSRPGSEASLPSVDNARFRYVAKASRSERNKGLDGMPERNRADVLNMSNPHDQSGGVDGRGVPYEIKPTQNHHPTVKPLKLMRWLVRLVARPGDVIVDPFAGSGTTGVACVMEGREFIGIEREAEYIEIARRRIEDAHRSIEAASSQTRLPVG